MAAASNKSNTPEKGVKPPSGFGVIAPIALGMGVCFGFALEKGRVFEPSVIIDQMLFHRFQMMKMFLSAVTTSMVVMSTLRAFKRTAPYAEHSRAHFFAAPRGLPSVALGTALLGVGMSIGGACPGTTIIQLGAGVNQGLFIVLGGLMAAGLYSYYESVFRPFIAVGRPQPENRTLDKMAGTSYARVALPMALALAAIVGGLEWVRPWYEDVGLSRAESLPAHLSLASVLAMKAWPPQIAGIIVGLLQIPAVLLLTVTLGSASSFATVAINMIYGVCPRAVESSQYMSSLRSGLALWQPTYLLGAMAGAFLSATLSGTWGTVTGLAPLPAFLAGFLLVGGARLANGCTSGHGISGMANLATVSFVAVPAMFGGAIGTAFALKALGYY